MTTVHSGMCAWDRDSGMGEAARVEGVSGCQVSIRIGCIVTFGGVMHMRGQRKEVVRETAKAQIK